MSDSKNLKLSGDSRFLQKVALKSCIMHVEYLSYWSVSSE